MALTAAAVTATLIVGRKSLARMMASLLPCSVPACKAIPPMTYGFALMVALFGIGR
jgi:hypothetical protein